MHVPYNNCCKFSGVRSPDLQNGGDLQFVMMDQGDFLYDASMPSLAYGSVNIGQGLWPYSFDYKSTQVRVHIKF